MIVIRRHDNGTVNTIGLSSGRTLEAGQIWRSNDPRRLRGVKIVGFHEIAIGEVDVIVENVVTRRRTMIDARCFKPGVRGWSLEVQA